MSSDLICKSKYLTRTSLLVGLDFQIRPQTLDYLLHRTNPPITLDPSLEWRYVFANQALNSVVFLILLLLVRFRCLD
jgi:hypothetical protein